MRKWRPGFKSLYCIPEVHGNIDSLDVILNRILPLRFSVGQEDSLVFLGDFIDRGPDSDKVLDRLISIRNEKILMIRGNHEEFFLKALTGSVHYKHWISSGGFSTLCSYLRRAGLESDPITFPSSRLKDIVPEEHIAFLESLPYKLDYEDYYFVHAGFNYLDSFENSSNHGYILDDSAGKYLKNCLKKERHIDLKSQKVVIAAHNPDGKSPFVHPRYMMLDAGAPQRLIVFDLNEMKCGMVKAGKSRVYDHKFSFVE